jgi:diketogulonate reductase-like aldo/keto reductase
LHELEKIWANFEAVKYIGRSKSIGVSNFPVAYLQHIVKTGRVKPAVNQISLNPYNYTSQKPILDYCAIHNIAIEAYSSLAPLTSYPGGPVDTPIAAAAKRLGITPAQVIFKWIRSKGAAVVTTSSNKQHLREYLAIEEIPPLTEEEIIAIDAAGARGPPQDLHLYITKILVTLLSLVLVLDHIRSNY